MTTHAENYRQYFTWARITKGPGTDQLELTDPDELFFSGESISENTGSYFGDRNLQLLEKERLEGTKWVLWFRHKDYPVRVLQMTYDSHTRYGIVNKWERILSSDASAEQKAEQADKGSILELPVWALTWMGLIYCAMGLCAYFWHDSLGVLLTICFGSAGVVGPEALMFAVYKSDRDNFWRALDTINRLDLRRTPNPA